MIDLKVGGTYQFIGQGEKIVYIGKEGNWNQFEKLNGNYEVWCELLDSDLHLIEEVVK